MTETEVKIRWNGTAVAAQMRIESRGYRLLEARTLEVDQLYDRPLPNTTPSPSAKSNALELQSGGRALRLRRRVSQISSPDAANPGAGATTPATNNVACVATYKGPAQDGPYKSREEIEFDVSDGDAFELVLNRLGYVPAFRYEKYRTTFGAADFEKTATDPHLIRAGAGVITLDETPIGVFLELEGAAEWIEQTRQRLGFTAQAYVKSSYAALYREHRLDHPDAAINMTFAPTGLSPRIG